MGQEQYTLSHMVKILRFLSMKNYNHCTRLVAELYEHGENEYIYICIQLNKTVVFAVIQTRNIWRKT